MSLPCRLLLTAILISSPSFPAIRQAVPSVSELQRVMQRLRSLHQKMGPPRPGDWLTLHKEAGQTFQEYLNCDPTLPRGRRRALYIQLLGDFTPDQRRIVELTKEFLGLYYNLPVKPLPDLPLQVIPSKARRGDSATHRQQILTTYILNDLLKPHIPNDAAAALVLTASDLWPREGWNFVFGQAQLHERAGVWSIYRFGDPSKGEMAFRLCLLRTIGTATHETAHMFSMLHCTRYDCMMNGSESLEESDRQPLELCPECLAKVCWATRTRPLERFRRLAEFCKRTGLKDEEAFYRKSIQAVGDKSDS